MTKKAILVLPIRRDSLSVVPENEQLTEQIEERETFIPLRMEADYRTTELHPNHGAQKHNLGTDTLPFLTKAIREKEQDMKAQDLGAEIGSSLDQVWHRFNERCSLQETRPTNDIEISLLERLERLSRLLHGSSLLHTPKLAHSRVEKANSRREHETRRTQGKDTIRKVKEKETSEVRGVLKTALEKESLSTHQTLVEKDTCYPNGLSRFVSADELKWDAWKENKPQSDAGQPEGQAWFEPYTRTQPWRELLRERHIQVEREKPRERKTCSENDGSSKPSALVPLSLQEALELRRPEFVSRSRERMKRLCLLVEERKIQAIFNKEREELFNPSSTAQQPKAAPAPPPLPSKRVIPISEMIQRSKRIYARLPEVQKRKEEERRKAEYNTYRLNAQLFTKKITNRVLGRRAPWQ